MRTSCFFVPFLLLPAAAQAPNLGPPSLLPGDLTIGTAVGDQRGPALATGGGVSLLVFDDLRGGDRDVFAVRLDGSGVPIDPVPIPIDVGPGDQTLPRVTWNGSSFLVAWVSQQPTAGYYHNEPRAIRVSPQGVVLGTSSIALPVEADFITVASNGSQFLVLTSGTSAGNSGLVGWRIDANGTLLTPNGVTLVPATYFLLFHVGVAWAGSNWLVTWSQSNSSTGDDVMGRRFDAALQPVDPAPVALWNSPRNEVQPHLTSNGSQFLITTWDSDIYWSQGVSCKRFTSTLQSLDAVPIVIGAQATYLPGPQAAWDGTQWVVGWLGYPSARIARLAANGTVLDPGGVLVEPNATASIYTPAIAGSAAGGAVLVWQDLRNQSTADLYGTTMGAGGALGVVQPVSLSRRDQQAPSVARGNDGHVVVFRSGDSAASVIAAQRFDAFGEVLDAQPIVVGNAGSTSRPAVAFDGTYWFVCWNRGTQVVGRRMSTDGTFPDVTANVVLNGIVSNYGPDVASNNGIFLVVAARPSTYPQNVFPWAARVRGSDGLLLDPTPLLVGSSYAVAPRVSAHGAGFVVVYENHWSHDQTSATITRTLVDTNGVVGTPGGVAIATSSAWGAVDVASDGNTALLVWASGSNWINEDVFVQRMALDGSLLGTPQNVTLAVPSGQSYPRVVFDGEQFVLACESLQNNPLFYDRAPDIVGLRIRPNGSVVDGQPFPLFVGPGHDRAVALGEDVLGHAVFAAHRFVPPGFASNRVACRIWGPAGLNRYGSGTPGCNGALRLLGASAPRPGNAAFALVGDRLQPSAPAFVLVGTAADVAGSDPFGLGVILHVQAAGLSVVTVSSDAFGVAALTIPLPNVASLVGASLFAQSASFFTACLPSPFGLATSNGVGLTVLP